MRWARFSIVFLLALGVIAAFTFLWIASLLPTKLEQELQSKLLMFESEKITVLSHSTDGIERVTAVSEDESGFLLFTAYRNCYPPKIATLLDFPDDYWLIPSLVTTPPGGYVSTSVPAPDECKTYSRRYDRFPSEVQIQQFRQEFDHPDGPT